MDAAEFNECCKLAVVALEADTETVLRARLGLAVACLFADAVELSRRQDSIPVADIEAVIGDIAEARDNL